MREWHNESIWNEEVNVVTSLTSVLMVFHNCATWASLMEPEHENEVTSAIFLLSLYYTSLHTIVTSCRTNVIIVTCAKKCFICPIPPFGIAPFLRCPLPPRVTSSMAVVLRIAWDTWHWSPSCSFSWRRRSQSWSIQLRLSSLPGELSCCVAVSVMNLVSLVQLFVHLKSAAFCDQNTESLAVEPSSSRKSFDHNALN